MVIDPNDPPSNLLFVTPVRSPVNVVPTASITLNSWGTVQTDGAIFQNMYDNDVATFYHSEVVDGGTVTFDFGKTIVSNSIQWMTDQRNASGDAGAATRIDIQISTDNATWTTLFTHNQVLGANTTSAIYNDSTGRQVFRYMRILADNVAAHRVKIYEIYVSALQ